MNVFGLKVGLNLGTILAVLDCESDEAAGLGLSVLGLSRLVELLLGCVCGNVDLESLECSELFAAVAAGCDAVYTPLLHATGLCCVTFGW